MGLGVPVVLKKLMGEWLHSLKLFRRGVHLLAGHYVQQVGGCQRVNVLGKRISHWIILFGSDAWSGRATGG